MNSTKRLALHFALDRDGLEIWLPSLVAEEVTSADKNHATLLNANTHAVQDPPYQPGTIPGFLLEKHAKIYSVTDYETLEVCKRDYRKEMQTFLQEAPSRLYALDDHVKTTFPYEMGTVSQNTACEFSFQDAFLSLFVPTRTDGQEISASLVRVALHHIDAVYKRRCGSPIEAVRMLHYGTLLRRTTCILSSTRKMVQAFINAYVEIDRDPFAMCGALCLGQKEQQTAMNLDKYGGIQSAQTSREFVRAFQTGVGSNDLLHSSPLSTQHAEASAQVIRHNFDTVRKTLMTTKFDVEGMESEELPDILFLLPEYEHTKASWFEKKLFNELTIMRRGKSLFPALFLIQTEGSNPYHIRCFTDETSSSGQKKGGRLCHPFQSNTSNSVVGDVVAVVYLNKQHKNTRKHKGSNLSNLFDAKPLTDLFAGDRAIPRILETLGITGITQSAVETEDQSHSDMGCGASTSALDNRSLSDAIEDFVAVLNAPPNENRASCVSVNLRSRSSSKTASSSQIKKLDRSELVYHQEFPYTRLTNLALRVQDIARVNATLLLAQNGEEQLCVTLTFHANRIARSRLYGCFLQGTEEIRSALLGTHLVDLVESALERASAAEAQVHLHGEPRACSEEAEGASVEYTFRLTGNCVPCQNILQKIRASFSQDELNDALVPALGASGFPLSRILQELGRACIWRLASTGTTKPAEPLYPDLAQLPWKLNWYTAHRQNDESSTPLASHSFKLTSGEAKQFPFLVAGKHTVALYEESNQYLLVHRAGASERVLECTLPAKRDVCPQTCLVDGSIPWQHDLFWRRLVYVGAWPEDANCFLARTTKHPNKKEAGACFLFEMAGRLIVHNNPYANVAREFLMVHTILFPGVNELSKLFHEVGHYHTNKADSNDARAEQGETKQVLEHAGQQEYTADFLSRLFNCETERRVTWFANDDCPCKSPLELEQKCHKIVRTSPASRREFSEFLQHLSRSLSYGSNAVSIMEILNDIREGKMTRPVFWVRRFSEGHTMTWTPVHFTEQHAITGYEDED